MARELFEFNSVDLVSSLGRRPIGACNFDYIPPYVDPMRKIPHPWVKWPDRGVIGSQSEEKNLIRTPDLHDSAIWSYSAAYHVNQKNVWDEDLQKEVWYWEKGTDTNTFLYDYTGGASPYAYHPATYYGNSVWLKSSYACSVKWFVQGTPKIYQSSFFEVPANTWTLVTQRLNATTGNLLTGFGWRIYGPNGVALQAGQKFWACEPTVHANYSYPTFSYPGHSGSQIVYPVAIPEKFSFGFWLRPLFHHAFSAICRILEFSSAGNKKWLLFFDNSSDKFSMTWENGGSSRYMFSQQFDDGASFDDIAQWMYVCGYVDLTQQNGTWFKVRTVESNTKYSNWPGAPDAWSDDIGPLGIMIRAYDRSTAYNGRSLMTDLMFVWDEKVTEEEFDEHYAANRPYFAENRLLGKNGDWRMDEFGNLAVKEITVG